MKFNVYKATRLNTKASILIEGLPGHGKTGTALLLAQGLTGSWDKVGFVDTENKSANLYEGLTLSSGDKVGQFMKVDILEEDGYKPMNYVMATEALIKVGASAVIQDSITHAWTRTGGVLDMVNTVEQRTKNKYTAWGDKDVVENKNALAEMLRSNKAHIISTVRVKEKFGLELDTQTGKNRVVSLGEQQLTQEGIKYEPDLVLYMEKPGSKTSHPTVRVTKTRYPMFELDESYLLTPELIAQLKKYLEEGADPEELIKEHHLAVVKSIVDFCQANPAKKPVYDALKATAGYKTTPIEQVPTKVLKQLYEAITK